MAKCSCSAEANLEAMRREKNRVQQRKFRAKKKRRAQELEVYVVELQEKVWGLAGTLWVDKWG